MVINASTPYEASLQLLRIIWSTDYRSAMHCTGIIAVEYVYFDPIMCRFYFSATQLVHERHNLLKRYMAINSTDVIHIAATKYPFSRIILGVVAYRKMFTYREYFELVRSKPEWFK